MYWHAVFPDQPPQPQWSQKYTVWHCWFFLFAKSGELKKFVLFMVVHNIMNHKSSFPFFVRFTVRTRESQPSFSLFTNLYHSLGNWFIKSDCFIIYKHETISWWGFFLIFGVFCFFSLTIIICYNKKDTRDFLFASLKTTY